MYLKPQRFTKYTGVLVSWGWSTTWFIISSRRLIYHQELVKRQDQELTKRIYEAQKNDPTPGDFVEMLAGDFNLINKKQNDFEIAMTSTSSYKQTIKSLIKAACFQQKQHWKVKNIQYANLETQKYMVSPLFFNEDVNQLHALRSRSTDIRITTNKSTFTAICSVCREWGPKAPHEVQSYPQSFQNWRNFQRKSHI